MKQRYCPKRRSKKIDLYTESYHVFYEFEGEPILFTCYEKEKREIYLSICSEIRFEQRWILVKSTVDLLISLVEKKIDIAQAFLQADEAIQVTMDLEGNEKSVIKSLREIDRLDLPEEGTWIRCDEEAALAYLREKEPIRELYFVENEDFNMAENKVELENSFGVRVQKNDEENSAVVELRLEINSKKNKNTPFELRISLAFTLYQFFCTSFGLRDHTSSLLKFPCSIC